MTTGATIKMDAEMEMDVALAPRAEPFPSELAGQQTPQSGRSGPGIADGAASDAAIPAMPRFYMTSDLRAATGLSRTHLDFYLREGIIVATARTESGYLLFDDQELVRLRQVVAMRQSGVGIREIRGRLGR